jgi:uncharacterized RDD family membrane protein YckC
MENTLNQVPQAVTVPLTDAKTGKRFLNFIIDIGIVIMLVVIFNHFYLIPKIIHASGAHKIFDIILIFTYFYGLESSIGQTVGKMLTKTRVTGINGETPTTQQMLVRTFSRFIPLEPVLYIGGKWLHDSLSKTRVVEVN